MTPHFSINCGLALAMLPLCLVYAQDQAVIPSAAVPEVSLKVEAISSNVLHIGAVVLDKKERTITVPARVRLRDQLVEYALVHESGKAYESLLTTVSAPVQINLAFVLLGFVRQDIPLQPGQPVPISSTNAVRIDVSWETDGVKITKPLGDLITLAQDATDTESRSTMSAHSWQYNGSIFDSGGFAAQRDGSVVSLIRDATALVNNIRSDLDNDQVHLAKTKLLPPRNWPVFVTFQLPSINPNGNTSTPQMDPTRGDKTNSIRLLQGEPKSL